MSEPAAAVELDEEDQWRAGLYALIGRLFFDGPDAALLMQLATNTADNDDTPLGQAWRQLAQASASVDTAALQHEHAMLFVGVGKTPVTPYTSAYATGVSAERHLLQLRQQLELWGLARDAATSMPEDHIAGVCDTLRHLILRGAAIEAQKEFFSDYLYLQGLALCGRLNEAQPSAFYLAVAGFTQAFLAVEYQGFDMISSPL